MIEDINQFNALNFTINTTENCNLRCKYCYEINKACNNIIDSSWKNFIDWSLSKNNPFEGYLSEEDTNENSFLFKGRIYEFIGGDSFYNVEVVDKIMSYINEKWVKEKLYKRFPIGWKATISTNGTFFKRKDVSDFLKKWGDLLSVSVSIDGCPEIHDKNRIYPDGRGSMQDIIEIWPYLQKTFPGITESTKSTCNRDSIPYLYDSLKFMHKELGIKYIHQNFIMEDMNLTDQDLKILDEQLFKCVEYVLQHSNCLYWSMIDETYSEDFLRKNYLLNKREFFKRSRCGSGLMPTLAVNGDIYPCFRWLPASQPGKEGLMKIGNAFKIEELNINKFNEVYQGSLRCNCTKDEKCKDCLYEFVCPYCIAGCYSEYGDFIRTTHICEVTKLQSKWATIYWRKLNETR